jgi:hypothetical protein
MCFDAVVTLFAVIGFLLILLGMLIGPAAFFRDVFDVRSVKKLFSKKDEIITAGREDIFDSSKRFLVVDTQDPRLTPEQKGAINYLCGNLSYRPFHRAYLRWKDEFGKFCKYDKEQL